jgi:hypothetical protein
VRFAHLDEAGTSRQEPFAVVAGIICHADKQWRALNQYLSDMADDLVPPEFRDGIIFHAKDIFHGAKRFDRENWPRERREKILLELAKIPTAFDVPVVIGMIEKKRHAWPGQQPKDIDASNYALAFGMAATSVEYFMREFAESNEIATLIAEDVPHMRRHAKAGYNVLKNPNLPWAENALGKHLPLERIAEQPMFAAKDESSILQVSDLLAFALCRRANGNKDVDPLIAEFSGNIITLPDWFAAEIGKAGGKRIKEL